MINVIDLPWYKHGQRYFADTLYGRVELKPALEPWKLMSFGLLKPKMGWAVLFRGQKIGWVKELKDAANYATNHVTAKANQKGTTK